jgi:hypothetical protein
LAVLVTVIGPLVAPVGTLTTSLVAPLELMVAGVPLNFTTELELNPIPVIVTAVPTGPLLALKPVIDSVAL